MSVFMLFMLTTFCSLIIMLELYCYIETGRELFYHIIKSTIKQYQYKKNKGKLPTDIVHIISAKRSTTTQLTRFNTETNTLEKDTNSFIYTLTYYDINNSQQSIPITKQTWDLLATHTNHPNYADSLYIDIKIDTHSFTQMILTGINSHLSQIIGDDK